MLIQIYTIVTVGALLLVTQIWLFSGISGMHYIHSMGFKPRRKYQVHIPEDVLQSFCHSEPGIDARRFRGKTKRNCFGECDQKLQTGRKQHHAIVAPAVTRLCFDNPFHGFYDCIWPLVHYMSTCESARREPELIIFDTKNISIPRQQKWVSQAQRAFLHNIGEQFEAVERTAMPRCTCYRNLIQFKRGTMWRPVRFHSERIVGNKTVLLPHPTGLKRVGLQLFRSAVLKEFTLDSEPLQENVTILIYGREDAVRRKWLDVDAFEKRLREVIPATIQIKRWTVAENNAPDAFEAQVRQMNSAGVIVAPHGAGMVNTLFCRRKTAVIEIASRMCGLANESLSLDDAVDVNDENTWTPWHAESLELLHFAAPCWYSGTGEYDFFTETEELVRLAQIALHTRQHM